MDLIDIGAMIKAQRAKLRLNQADLARQAGVSRATLSALENGQLPELGVNRLLRILEAVQLELNVTPNPGYRPTMDELQERRDRIEHPRHERRYRG